MVKSLLLTLALSIPATCQNCKSNTDLYVDTSNSCAWPGSDFGARLNAAAASLPPTGGVINAERGTYDYSIPIVIASVGKPARIICASDGRTRFSYQGPNGTTAFILAGTAAASIPRLDHQPVT